MDNISAIGQTFSTGIKRPWSMSNLFRAYLLQWKVSSILSHSMASAWWPIWVTWELHFLTLGVFLRAWLHRFRASTVRTRIAKSASERKHGSLWEHIIAVNAASVSSKWTITAHGSITVSVRGTWSTSCNLCFTSCLPLACSHFSVCFPSTICWPVKTRAYIWITV